MTATTKWPRPDLPKPPERLFPLIRHLSWRLTPVFIRLKFNANTITIFSLVSGLCAGLLLAQGTQTSSIYGAIAFALAYLLDNCDGEVARATGNISRLGARLDDIADWLVDAAFFAGLGIGVAVMRGADIWMWLGFAAAAGGTIDSAIKLFRTRDEIPEQTGDREATPMFVKESRVPKDLTDWVFLFYQKLSRADFWLIVLVLVVIGWQWVLLPLAAIGAQIYWISGLSPRARGWEV